MEYGDCVCVWSQVVKVIWQRCTDSQVDKAVGSQAERNRKCMSAWFWPNQPGNPALKPLF